MLYIAVYIEIGNSIEFRMRVFRVSVCVLSILKPVAETELGKSALK